LFGAYHLSPLDGMYRIFWQYPASQLLGSVCTGMLWGYVYAKRGYETSVLGHTLSNWIWLLLFVLFASQGMS
jgi:membrane protease YdiL (CAAX protease family)